MEDGGGLRSRSSLGSEKRNLGFRVENPFTLKFGQIFTGFGVGCGIGIGVGRPIYLGAIPALQQVISATRGATDAFSGVGRHVNGSLKRLGVKNIEAGIGCGIGIGHGFGVGLALKPGVVHRIQHSFGQVIENIMMRFGNVPGVSSLQIAMPPLPGYAPHSKSVIIGTSGETDLLQTESSTVLKSSGSTSKSWTNDPAPKAIMSDSSFGSRTERVLNSFLQDIRDNNVDADPLAGNLRTENSVLQMLLKHQGIIEELVEENEKLRQILIEDLKIPPSKFQVKNPSDLKAFYPCSDCFECRRRKRRTSR